MLRKMGAFTLGLLCLIGTSSVVLGAEDSGAPNAPSITELREAAGMGEATADVGATLDEAEKRLQAGQPYVANELLDQLLTADLTSAQEVRLARLKKQADQAIGEETAVLSGQADGDVSSEQATAAERALEKYRRASMIRTQLNRQKAAELTATAHQLLYFENNPERAAELAAQALALDPTNQGAADIKLEAEAQLNPEGPSAQKRAASGLITLPQVRQQAAVQSLQNSIAKARELYAQGDYEESLKQWRRAQMYVDALNVTMNVENWRQAVEAGLSRTQDAYLEAERDRALASQREAQQKATERTDRMLEEERKERARLVEDIDRLIREKKFDEASDVLTELQLLDKSDKIVPIYREIISKAEDDFLQARLNAAREHGDRRTDQWTADKEVVPDTLFEYPDPEFWRDVVMQREYVEYPSQEIIEDAPEEDQLVYQQLEEVYPFSFDQTPVDQVVDFLQQVTEPSYILFEDDIPATGAPVTLDVTTTLRKALDHISDLTGLSWKVEDGVIKIGSADSLRSYDMRVYDIRDLLISFDDLAAGDWEDREDTAGGGGTTGGGGDFGGGFQFGQFGQVRPQYGGGSGDDDDEDEGYGTMTDMAENLVLLIKQACHPDTWQSVASTGLIDISGDDDDSGGGGGDNELPAEFGTTGAFGGGPGGAAGGFGAQPGFGGGFPGEPGFGPAGGPQGGTTTRAAGPRGTAFLRANDPGSLMIVQTPEVHRCIEDLFRKLREAMRIQVKVDVRFLSVSTDFLREVGFEWQNFSLDNDFSGPFGALSGFGLASPAFGGFSPFQTPGVDGVVFVPDPADPTTGTFQAVGAPSQFLLSHPFGSPEFEVDEETGTITFTKTPLLGNPAVGTGIPFFGSQDTGLNLNMGWQKDDFSLSGFFRLAQERNALRTLSAPEIMLANGQRGFITVSTQSAYVTTYSVEEGVLIPEIGTVADVADLTVRPIVSADRRYVFLELSPVIQTTDLTTRFDFRTFTGVAGGEVGGGAGAEVENFIALPRVLTETLATTVGVPDRGVVIVGGLTRASRENREAGVPILNKIPILKRLFSAEGRLIDRETLFVMAKPHIVMFGTDEAEQDRRMQ